MDRGIIRWRVVERHRDSEIRDEWCWRRELNPHGTKYHEILSLARLPVPPLQQQDFEQLNIAF